MRIVETITGDEPITVADAKLFGRITTSADDTMIEEVFIPAARSNCEKYISQAIVEKTIEVTWDDPAVWYFQLPIAPVTEVTKVEVIKDGEAEEVEFEQTGEGVVEIDQIWSTSTLSVRITYTTGLDPIPADVKLAVLRQFSVNYEHREEGELLNSIKTLLAPYRYKLWF